MGGGSSRGSSWVGWVGWWNGWQRWPWWWDCDRVERSAAVVGVAGVVLLPAWKRLLVHPRTVVATGISVQLRG